jgi:hypothetical protein
MSKSARLVLGLAAAATMLAAFAASASARNLSISNQSLRATWREMIFTEPFGGTVVCPVTLEGTLHNRTIAKEPYRLIGYITRGIVGTAVQCSGGEATILQESLPWHVRYQSFEGRLPDITRINTLISRASFRVRLINAGVTCLFTTRETTEEHARGLFRREAGGALTDVEVEGTITSNEACALGLRIRGRLSGRSTTLTLLNAATRLTVTLI